MPSAGDWNGLTVSLPQYIEIETSSYCNRQCDWCPNGVIGARNTQQLMPWDLLERIIQELKHDGYTGWLALHNFNEPLANPRLVSELDLVHDQLPACRPSIFSNGDFLSACSVNALADLGVVYLRVTLYPDRMADDPMAGDASRIGRWLRDRGMTGLCKWERRPARQGPAAVGSVGEMDIEVITPDIARYNWRGGTVPLASKADRTKPCRMTSHSASIDYRGRLKMCCNVYPEAAGHASYIVGSLSHQTFRALWLSPAMTLFRSAHLAADWSMSSICRRCNHELPDEDAQPGAPSRPR
ncbi:MAG: radical SAM protein [Verrucomicrobia bacterium]|nr:radical SAM protein [Verrucomicrobiota bacterium]